MIHVCFAAGPLHLMSIKELIQINPNSKFYIFLMLYKDNIMVNKQMFRSVELLKLKNIHEIYLYKSKFLNICQNLILAKKISVKYKKKLPTFVIIDFRNTFMHYLRALFHNSKFILIDDGFQTYVNYKKYIEKKIYLPYLNYYGLFGRLNKFIHFGLQFNKLYSKEFELFSIYAKELRISDKYFNQLTCINKIKSKKEFEYDDDSVFFCGTKLVERGVLTMEEELNIVKKLRDYWLSENKKLIYIAKRTSSEVKLNKIKNDLSVEVINFDLPLELALLEYHKLPSIVCSLGSTLNKTLPMIYNKINTYLINVNEIEKKSEVVESWTYSRQILKDSYLEKNILKI